ncbi:MAG: DUF433 domain-containing protein [Leadbetterella sp.]|nr:DUF433 domain-containing protein [Leadbetterella sp.]
MNWKSHIESNPNILFGKPVISKTRISVDLILEKLASGDTIDDILEAYPNISKNDIFACLQFASESIKNEVVFSLAS